MTTNASRTPDTSWIPDSSTFAARLALVRWHMGWNMKEAERECGISQNLWSNWEAGAMPRNYLEAVAKIVWRTKVDKLWLMTGDGSPEARTTDYGSDGSREAQIISLFPAPGTPKRWNTEKMRGF